MSDTDLRIIHAPRLGAEENMAQDRALLDLFLKDGVPIFRLYSWEESVTIGISQEFDACVALDSVLELYRARYARRMTGGGILYHGHDLSYSLILPSTMMQGLSVKKSYERITAFLLDFYQGLGLDAHWAKDDPTVVLGSSPFCQVGFEPYDIIIEGRKIGGNAQKRTRKAIFQHGSVPLRHNKHGVSLEELGVALSEEEARERLAQSYEKIYNEFEERT